MTRSLQKESTGSAQCRSQSWSLSFCSARLAGHDVAQFILRALVVVDNDVAGDRLEHRRGFSGVLSDSWFPHLREELLAGAVS